MVRKVICPIIVWKTGIYTYSCKDAYVYLVMLPYTVLLNVYLYLNTSLMKDSLEKKQAPLKSILDVPSSKTSPQVFKDNRPETKQLKKIQQSATLSNASLQFKGGSHGKTVYLKVQSVTYTATGVPGNQTKAVGYDEVWTKTLKGHPGLTDYQTVARAIAQAVLLAGETYVDVQYKTYSKKS